MAQPKSWKSPVRKTTKPVSLFRHKSFALLWSSQTISFLGTQITYVALPLTAVVYLHATPMQAGLLSALEQLPFLLFGLLVGVLVDRRARRQLLIWANLIRFAALTWIPAAYLLNVLTMAQLWIVVFVVGTMTVFFEIAYMSYLPGLVDRDRLMEANAKLQASESVAEVAGPGLAGALISVVSTPLLIAVDAVSYLVSVLTLLRMPKDQAPAPTADAETESTSLLASLREGFAVISGNTLLRWCTAAVVLFSLSFSAVMALYFLFLVREAGMGSVEVGLIVAVSSVGGLVGALLSDRLTQWLGVGPTLVVALSLPPLGFLLLSTVHGHSFAPAAIAGAGTFIGFFGIPVFDVTVISVRQAVTPEHLQGRASATVRSLSWGTLSVGALLGGALGGTLGLRTTVQFAALGLFLPPLFLLLSPVRRMRQVEMRSAAEPTPDLQEI